MAARQRTNGYKQAKGNEGNKYSAVSENASVNNSNQSEMANWQRIDIYTNRRKETKDMKGV